MRFIFPRAFTATKEFGDQGPRGEWRWVENATEALLQAGHTVVTPVHRIFSEDDIISEFPGHIVNCDVGEELTNLAQDSVFITHGMPGSAFLLWPTAEEVPRNCAKYVFQLFGGPVTTEGGTVPEIAKLAAIVGREKIYITHSFYSSGEWKQIQDRFDQVGLKDRCFILETPAVRQVHWHQDNFDKDILLWFHRDICGWLNRLGDREIPHAQRLFNWITSKLYSDSSKKLLIITGFPVSASGAPINCFGEERPNLRQEILTHPSVNSLLKVEDRVEILHGLSWNKCLALLSETKMLVNNPMAFGGPPLEAASFGIPTVSLQKRSSFMDIAAECLSANDIYDSQLVKHYERLYSNHGFYRQLGDKMRFFTDQHWSYKAFVSKLIKLIEV